MQLLLPFSPPPHATLDTFVAGQNSQLLAHIEQLCQGEKRPHVAPLTHVSGASGSGKSHLLYGLCQKVLQQQQTACYVDFAEAARLQPGMLEHLEQHRLIALDNVHRLAGKLDWQKAVFDLINRVIEEPGTELVTTANSGPVALDLQLPDLVSRLSWGHCYHLQSLSDADKQNMLMVAAKHRGMVLNPDVAKYLLNHFSRDENQLMQLVERLDALSLREQSKLTRSFIKKVIAA